MPALDGLADLGNLGDPHIIDTLLAELAQLGTSRPQYPNGICVLNALSKLTNKGNAKVINVLLRVMRNG